MLSCVWLLSGLSYFLIKNTAEIDLASIADRSAVIKAIECGNMDVATEKLSALNPEVHCILFISYAL